MRIEPEIAGVSLVLIGNFNPSIFVPDWFGWRGLLPKATVDSADLTIAHPQITQFSSEWLQLQVVPERFSISTTHVPGIRLRDLAVRIFREQLPHTRLTAMGINREVHFSVGSFGDRDQIGKLLAPIEPWGGWAQKLGLDRELGGMTSLTMTSSNAEGEHPDGRINVTVEPSNRVGDGSTGIYVRINDHFVAKDPEGQTATSDIVTLLEMNFDNSLRRADQIIDHVMSLKGR